MRRGFWRKARRVASGLPFAEDLLAAYYCAFDRNTPPTFKVALIGALAYFVLPFDFIPDMLPFVGYTDDAAVLAAAIKLVSSNITATIALPRAMRWRVRAEGRVVAATASARPCPSHCGRLSP